MLAILCAVTTFATGPKPVPRAIVIAECAPSAGILPVTTARPAQHVPWIVGLVLPKHAAMASVVPAKPAKPVPRIAVVVHTNIAGTALATMGKIAVLVI